MAKFDSYYGKLLIPETRWTRALSLRVDYFGIFFLFLEKDTRRDFYHVPGVIAYQRVIDGFPHTTKYDPKRWQFVFGVDDPSKWFDGPYEEPLEWIDFPDDRIDHRDPYEAVDFSRFGY